MVNENGTDEENPAIGELVGYTGITPQLPPMIYAPYIPVVRNIKVSDDSV